MNRFGNRDINTVNKSTRFNSETARIANKKSHEAKRRKCSAFNAVRPLVDETAPVAMLPDGVVKFWENHGVSRDSITPLMAEITPIYAAAIKEGDIGTLERVYRLLGLTFDSNREHNINVSLGNKDDKPFEINYIVNGQKEVKEDG